MASYKKFSAARRQILESTAALGTLGAASVAAVDRENSTPAQTARVNQALRQTMEQFQEVKALEIADGVQPALVFHASQDDGC